VKVFFAVAHDPTQLDRQGPDQGSQYRSAIFYTTPEQKQIAEAYIDQLNKIRAFANQIVTKVEPLRDFFPAEDYHQNYAALHPGEPYIATYDMPKVRALKKLFPRLYV
jgi:peptide-methionine (S)-S-oxide reductase